MRKNLKKCKNRPKIDPLLVFVDFYAEGVYGNTFCIKDESKLRTQWFIIEILKKSMDWFLDDFLLKKGSFFGFLQKSAKRLKIRENDFYENEASCQAPKLTLS